MHGVFIDDANDRKGGKITSPVLVLNQCHQCKLLLAIYALDCTLATFFFLGAYTISRVHRFDIDGVPFVIRFTDALRVITINDELVNLTFGGPPLRIAVNYVEHYLRLSNLPHGVKPGNVWINSMPGKCGLPPPPPPAPSGPLLSEADSSTRAPAAGTAAPASRSGQPTDEQLPDGEEHNPALPMRM